jgi:hypothetical protein
MLDAAEPDGPGARPDGPGDLPVEGVAPDVGGVADHVAADTFDHRGKVKCGSLVCILPSRVCCARSPAEGGKGPECKTPAACMLFSALACDGPEDCSKGQVCCGASTSGIDAIIALCFGNCSASNARILCHTAADCPSGFKKCCSTKFSGGTLPVQYCEKGSTCP